MDKLNIPDILLRSIENEKVIFSQTAGGINELSDYLVKIMFGCWWMFTFINLQIFIMMESPQFNWQVFPFFFLKRPISGLPFFEFLEELVFIYLLFSPGLLAIIGLVSLLKGLKLRFQKNIPFVITDSGISMLINREVKVYPWSCFSGTVEVFRKKKGVKILMNSDPAGAKATRIYMEGIDDPGLIADECLGQILKARKESSDNSVDS